MKRLNHFRAAIALSLLLTASPALASDFSGMLYIFLALVAAVWGAAFGIVLAVRKLSAPGSPAVDAISAIILSACIAPATLIEMYGETTFSLLPGWLMPVFGEDWAMLFPGPTVSFAVVAGLLYVFFKRRRLGRFAPAEESAP